MSVFKRWLSQFFADPQAVILAMLLVVGFGIVIVLGDMLAPVLAAIVLAYLLEGLVRRGLRRCCWCSTSSSRCRWYCCSG